MPETLPHPWGETTEEHQLEKDAIRYRERKRLWNSLDDTRFDLGIKLASENWRIANTPEKADKETKAKVLVDLQRVYTELYELEAHTTE